MGPSKSYTTPNSSSRTRRESSITCLTLSNPGVANCSARSSTDPSSRRSCSISCAQRRHCVLMTTGVHVGPGAPYQPPVPVRPHDAVAGSKIAKKAGFRPKTRATPGDCQTLSQRPPPEPPKGLPLPVASHRAAAAASMRAVRCRLHHVLHRAAQNHFQGSAASCAGRRPVHIAAPTPCVITGR